MPNRLAASFSPHLLEHCRDPIDWYPWCDEAIALAVRLELPIFMSIGFSTSHLCHVMARETFSNEYLAKLLNGRFICIKVDREERPDIDAIYGRAAQQMLGTTGWPLNLFLTPDLKPFFAALYIPPSRTECSRGFDEIVLAASDVWLHQCSEVLQQAAAICEAVEDFERPGGSAAESSAARDSAARDSAAAVEIGSREHIIESAVRRLFASVDQRWGGFGGHPKLPHTSDLEILLRVGQRTGESAYLEAVRLTLIAMSRGGVYDLLGGGFSRYSLDDYWFVPHFEKMLYDNAALSSIYLEAYQATGDDAFSAVARATLEYLTTELLLPAGGFCSSQDGDCDGVKGKHYLWSADEIRSLLGENHAGPFMERFGVTDLGNFGRSNILVETRSIEGISRQFSMDRDGLNEQLQQDLGTLRQARNQRSPPVRDIKVITAWNALAVTSFALASQVLHEPRYESVAITTAQFVLDHLQSDDGGLLRIWHDGRAFQQAFLDDYACWINANVTLSEVIGDTKWLDNAELLADRMLRDFSNGDGRGLSYSPVRTEQNVEPCERSKRSLPTLAQVEQWQDDGIPGSIATAIIALTRLGRATGRQDLLGRAEEILAVGMPWIEHRSLTCSGLISALELWSYPRET